MPDCGWVWVSGILGVCAEHAVVLSAKWEL